MTGPLDSAIPSWPCLWDCPQCSPDDACQPHRGHQTCLGPQSIYRRVFTTSQARSRWHWKQGVAVSEKLSPSLCSELGQVFSLLTAVSQGSTVTGLVGKYGN